MGDIVSILTGGETILWQGKPALLPFFARAIVCFLVGLGVFGSVAWLVASQSLPPRPDLPATSLFLAPFLLSGFLLALCYPVYEILSYRCLSYAITSQRVVLRSGILERVIEIVDLDQIVHADMDVDLMDILLGFGRTGSLSFTTSPADAPENPEEPPHVLSHIPHPDDVLRFFHRAEFDEKTDIQYPNELRSNVNPGYPTSYSPPPQP